MKRLLVMLCACSNSANVPKDAPADVITPDAEASTPDALRPIPGDQAIVQIVSFPTTTGASATLEIAATQPGNFLAVAVQMSGAPVPSVHSVTLPTGEHFAEESDTLDLGCERGVQIWTFPNAPAGTKSLQLTLSATMTYTVDVIEISGVSRFGLVNMSQSVSLPGQTQTWSPEVIPFKANRFALAQFVTCGAVTGVETPFTRLSTQPGTAFAYFVTTADGSAGATWAFSGTTWTQWIGSFY